MRPFLPGNDPGAEPAPGTATTATANPPAATVDRVTSRTLRLLRYRIFNTVRGRADEPLRAACHGHAGAHLPGRACRSRLARRCVRLRRARAHRRRPPRPDAGRRG